jgi:TP901 family phage tail tape measure protein
MATNTEKIVVQVVVQGDKQLGNLEKKTKSTTKSFGKMGASILAAATAFTTITRTIGSAIRSFRDFEFQMAKVKAVTGASEKDFHKLTKTAKELGRSTFFTAQQVAELQTNFGKLGFSTQEILDAQEATLLLATATDADLGRAAIVAGAAVRGFGLDANETARVVDVMTKAFSSSALDIEKFQTSMTKVAPIAAGANITLESTSAVMGTLTDAGIEASIAGTSLRNIFLKMQDSSSDLSKHLGFTVNSSDDLQKALTMLNKEGLSNEEIMSLVDLRQVAAFQTMIKGSERIQQLTVDFNNANGAAAEMAAIVGDTLEGAFKRMTSASEGLAIELTDKLGGGLKNLINQFAVFINRVTDNSDAVAKYVNILIDVVKWLGLYKLGVVAARVATNALTVSIKGLTTAIARTGLGLAIVLLGEYAAKLFLTSDAASAAAKSTNDLADATQRIEDRATSFNRMINKDLANTIEKSKENIKQLEEEDRIRELAQANHIRGIFKMNNLEKKATADERKRLKDKIALERANQKELRRIKNEEALQKKSLITLAQEELAILQRMPETTEEEISTKNKLIEVVEKEIKRLKELGIARDEVNKKGEDIVVWNPYQEQASDLDDLIKKDAEFNQKRLDQAQEVSNKLFEIFSQNAANRAAREQKVLEEQKDAGMITQEQYEEGVEDIQRKAFERKKRLDIAQAIINGALAMTTVAGQTGVLSFAFSPFIAAMTAAQIALISSQKFANGGMIEEFANGGMVNGKSHAQGGEKFAVGGRVVELEGGEAVINKRSTAMFRNQLSAMNSAGGGVKFADGGLLNMPSFSQQQFNALGQNQMMGAMGGASKVVVVEADITSTQNSVSVIESDAII